MPRSSEGAKLLPNSSSKSTSGDGGRTMGGMRLKDFGQYVSDVESGGYDEPWYHGDISSQVAQHRLRQAGLSNGLFLVRKRGTSHVICLCYNDKVENYLVKNEGGGGYTIGKQCDQFYSLRDMVTHFRDNTGGMSTTLTHECPKTNAPDPQFSGHNDESFSELRDVAHKKTKKVKLTTAQRSIRAEQRKRLRMQQLRDQLDSLPPYKPWLTRGTALLMGIILIAELGLGGISNIAFPGQPVPQVQMQKNFSSRTETVSDSAGSNIMIGPSTTFLIKFGAKFGPCMREDIAFKSTRAISWEREENLGLGCCTVTILNQCGMAPELECKNVTSAVWVSTACGSSCASASMVMRPCCYLDGSCDITRNDYCVATGGVPSQAGLTCETAQCLNEICGLGGVPNENADQWYRFITPLFLHAGVLHYLGTMMLQLSLGTQIERQAGTLRTALIFFIAGIGGYATSGVFSPNIPSVGATSASFGFLGVTVVDLFQTWQIAKQPWKRLFWTVVETCIYFGIGLLPFVDNWSHVGGFVFGILAAIVFLPYLTFGLMDSLRKRCFMFICIPTLVFLFFIFFLVFYSIQSTTFCPGCKYIQCYPFTPDFCKDVPGWNNE